MSIPQIPYPSDFQIDHAAAHQEERRRRAFQRLEVGDILSTLDDLIASEPEERNHPLFHLVEFLLDRRTAVDGRKLYDDLRALVLTAIDRCLEAALQEDD